MSEQPTTALPEDLQARLDAAGVTDEASLAAALEADPQLKAGLEAFSTRQRWTNLEAWYGAFTQTRSSEDMIAFRRQVPTEMEAPFIGMVEGIIQQAQESNDQGTVQMLSGRLEDFKRIRERQAALQQLSPVARALMDFVQAPDEAAARQVFAEQRALLQPYEAQDTLERQFRSDDPATQQRIDERSALLRELRRAAVPAASPLVPPPAPPASQPPTVEGLASTELTFDNQGMQARDVYQAQTVNVAQATIHQAPPELRWVAPAPPAVDARKFIDRPEPLQDVSRLLDASGGAAISSVAVHGMGGTGKTMLAQLLADRRKGQYGGVIWQPIGGEHSAAQVTGILNRWASHAFGGVIRAGHLFTPAEVRALLSGHGRLLVVLDDVWDVAAVQPLFDALPPDSEVLVTTRIRQVALDLNLELYELDVLSEAEARSLMALRLKRRPLTAKDEPWMIELMACTGRHALALDVALGSLRRRQPGEWADVARRIAADLRQSHGFGELPLDERQRSRVVERSLQRSYAELSPLAQERLRSLGVFAPGAPFATPMAAALWGCAVQEASDALNLFADAALLGTDPQRPAEWRQHGLLRGYALALLRACGEYDATAARHAETYLAAMRQADDAQRYYELLPAYPQLRHAFEWAAEQSLATALDLIGNCANLQTAFGLAHDNLAWCQQALTTTRQRGTAQDVARAHGALGNALARAATLPGEDRRARLYDALAAYEEALKFRRPDTAPLAYAMTQNNRATILSDLATLPDEDRSQRLRAALAMAWEAYTLFGQLQHAPYQHIAANTLRTLRDACGTDFGTWWQQLGQGDCPDWLGTTNEGTGQLTSNERLEQAVRHYLELRQATAQSEKDVAACQSAVDAGEALFAGEFRDLPGVDWDALREDLAGAYTSLCIAHEHAGDLVASLAATDRAITLQPDKAMWQRNRAGTLIDLGRLEEAGAAIARARELEPGAARLHELDEQLAAARARAKAQPKQEDTPTP